MSKRVKQTEKIPEDKTLVNMKTKENGKDIKNESYWNKGFSVFLCQQILALITTGSICYVGYMHGGFIPTPNNRDIPSKLAYTLRCLVGPLCTVAFAIVKVGNMRFLTNASNPLSGNEDLVQVWKCILSNTLEQLVVVAVGLLSLSTFLSTEQEVRLIPIACSLFVLGRIAFMRGYTIKPLYRAFGMCINFQVLLVVLIANILCLSFRGIASEL